MDGTSGLLAYSTSSYKLLIEAGGDYITIYGSWLLGKDNPFCEVIRERIRAQFAQEHAPDSLIAPDELERRFRHFLGMLTREQQQQFDASVELQRAKYQSEFVDRRLVRMRNARTWASPSLESTGFALVPHSSSVSMQDIGHMNPQQCQQYYKELTAVAKRLVSPQGAGQVHAFCGSHVIRRESNQGTGNADDPLVYVHNDFTDGYRGAVLSAFDSEADEDVAAAGFHPGLESVPAMKAAGLDSRTLGRSRVLVLNMWRGVVDVVKRMPLALCDVRSVRPGDLFQERLAPHSDELKTCGALFSPQHRWCYFPDATPQELIVFKTYDSAMNPFVPVLHTAFDDPLYPEGTAPSRVSCEARVLVVVAPDLESKL